MKIVVLDGFTLNPGDLSWKELEKLGDLEVYERTSYDLNNKDLIVERAKEADIILTNKTPINKEIIDELPKLKYIGVLATGYNIIDIEAAKTRGIVVTNIPSYGTDAVAQMTFALILELTNHVGLHNQLVKEGKWSKNIDWCFWEKPLVELSGKTLGIIGYGRIGKRVGQIAEVFGMKVLTMTRDNEKKSDKGVQYVEFEELLRKSDIISLHCPLTDETKGIINRDSLSMMKENAILINTSRGGLIIEEDLYEGLKNKSISACALDVLNIEPVDINNPLLQIDNCIITPHIAWAPRESRERLLNIAVENIRSFLNGKPSNIIGLN